MAAACSNCIPTPLRVFLYYVIGRAHIMPSTVRALLEDALDAATNTERLAAFDELTLKTTDGIARQLLGMQPLDEDWYSAEVTVECPRCGHGLCWHPPLAREVEHQVDRDRIRGTGDGRPMPAPRSPPDPDGCAGNCKVCDLIEGLLDVASWDLRR